MGSPRHNALAFDDAGAPVPSVAAVYPDDDTPAAVADRSALGEHEAMVALLQRITDARGAAAVGRRALAVAYLLGALPGCRDQEDLARRMGCTQQRASQACAEIRRNLCGSHR